MAREPIYTAHARVTGGRADGHGKTDDGVLEDPDDPAAQAVAHAARGLVAMFPLELPILQMATAGGGADDAPGGPRPAGISLPMAG